MASVSASPLRRERHVIDDAGAELLARLATDDVQNRVVARVHPRPGKPEIGTRAVGETHELRVELDRPRHVVGEDGEMIHARKPPSSFRSFRT